MHTVRLYCKPYVRKYVAGRLAQDRLQHDAASQQLLQQLQQILRVRVLAVVYDHQDARPRWWVELVTDQPADPSHSHRYQANALLERTWRTEMYAWVDYYRMMPGMPTLMAMQQYMRHWSITEEDYRLDTALRVYQNHCKRTGQVRPYRKRSVHFRRGGRQ